MEEEVQEDTQITTPLPLARLTVKDWTMQQVRRRHLRSLRRHTKPSSDPVTVLPASASTSPPPYLPRPTRASKRLYLNALESVPASDSTDLDPLGDANRISAEAPVVGSHQTLQRLPLAESRNDNIQRVCAPKPKEVKPTSKKPKKVTYRPAKTTTIAPKTSKPSRKRPKTTRPPAPPTESHSSPPLPLSSATRSRAQADIDIDDPMPTPADLERALYEGITFTRSVDISLSALPFLFGLNACGYQFGCGGGSGVGILGSDDSGTTASWTDATATSATTADDVNDSAMVET
ncbi:hypothetical protein D9611_012825 [Ephemerocybe angulata]|uniref:Uncharacterized protein n=1 Tax=Ephemerocybe angulata TaxID=980116 RepID=A0A8H5BB46_9AGAR|nr:hypothetical protein D9611_012825 [Tulosesus angulatus]